MKGIKKMKRYFALALVLGGAVSAGAVNESALQADHALGAAFDKVTTPS